MNREFLMLAKEYDPACHSIANCYVSLKLDGQRAFWDGGVSRGLLKATIPWANNKKDQRYKEPPVATGLWSRYGNVIHAPAWFLDNLPQGIFLDGELYAGRQQFQRIRSIISTLVPDEEAWRIVKYRVFDIPSPNVVFQQGKINNPNFSHFIVEDDCHAFMQQRLSFGQLNIQKEVMRYDKTVTRMSRLANIQNDTLKFLKQVRMPGVERAAQVLLHEMLDDETSRGGEGLIIRAPESIWVPKRVQSLLKVKKFKEDTATVVGYTSGEGKYLGMLGALTVEWNAKRFNLSGFRDVERALATAHAITWARSNPGKAYDGSYSISSRFPLGSEVRFRYREVTDEGLPREARYWL